MLKVDSPLLASSIKTLRELKLNKVFELQGFTTDRLIVKFESIQSTPEQIKAAGKVVKSIDPLSKAKVCSKTEEAELLKFCNSAIDTHLYFKDFEGSSSAEYKKSITACEHLKKMLGFGDMPLIKMARQEVTDLQEVANKAFGDLQETGPLQSFISALIAPKGLEGLGQMIAADAFNGNVDRFNFFAKPLSGKFGPHSVDLRVLVNPGNIIQSRTQSGVVVSLLDYVDPGSQYRDQSVSLQENENRVRGSFGDWPGRYMVKKVLRLDCSEKVVADFEDIFKPNKTFFSKPKLGKNAVKRVAFGMWFGTNKIVESLKPKLGKLPKGMQDRVLLYAGAEAP
jgi:hypothetical protein